MPTPTLSPEVRDVLRLAAREAGETVYLVGGAVRDLLLGRGLSDLDLAASRPQALAQALAARLGRRAVVLDEKWQVYRIVGPRFQLDVARLKGASIEEDLAARDFTIDAMARPLSAEGPGPLLDPHSGRRDLRLRRVRALGEGVFEEDPLRLLRAYRISSQLGFSIEPRTAAWIRKHRSLISRPSPERRHEELMRLLEAPDSARWLKLMDESRLLTALLPELEPERLCARVYYGAGGVLKHSLACVDRLDFLFDHLAKALGELAPDVERHISEGAGPFSLKAVLRLAALLHDLAKPETARRIGGRLRFFGHEEKGASMASKILQRLRFSSAHRELLEAVIGEHLRPGNLAANPTISDRAVYRFFQDLKGQGVNLLLVCWADHASYLSMRQLLSVLPRAAEDPQNASYGRTDPAVRKTLRHLQVVAYLLRQHFRRPETVQPPRLADGKDVMRLLGLPPGPRVGSALRALREAQAEGKVKDKKSALAFLRGLAPSALR